MVADLGCSEMENTHNPTLKARSFKYLLSVMVQQCTNTPNSYALCWVESPFNIHKFTKRSRALLSSSFPTRYKFSMNDTGTMANRPKTRQRTYKQPPSLAVPNIDDDATERKRVLNVLAQRRYREFLTTSVIHFIKTNSLKVRRSDSVDKRPMLHRIHQTWWM